ncbi:tigger transposable element-derived 1-like [Pelobates cultripes]|uniref:Tigger transposable element-derived 1-like n=1 Tax=Pelobates cultripes TaxID=61616 RepID=A0AAD1SF93_PELCU|nr:tigger transposable element-derived 1-like [Pelobates cultripes]
MHGEAASSDIAAAEEFATEFLEVIVSGGYLPQQVFNCDDTGLFWKRMTKRTFITEQEISLPGHKPMKDRLTLTLHEFWREHFDIVSFLQIITIARAGVSQTNLNSAWRNMWPDCVVKPASSAFAPAPESTVLEEIVSLGWAMGLEETEEDVYELVEDVIAD